MPDLPWIFIASSGQKRLEIGTWRKVKARSDGATKLGGRAGAVSFLALFLRLLQFLETAWSEGGPQFPLKFPSSSTMAGGPFYEQETESLL